MNNLRNAVNNYLTLRRGLGLPLRQRNWPPAQKVIGFRRFAGSLVTIWRRTLRQKSPRRACWLATQRARAPTFTRTPKSCVCSQARKRIHRGIVTAIRCGIGSGPKPIIASLACWR